MPPLSVPGSRARLLLLAPLLLLLGGLAVLAPTPVHAATTGSLPTDGSPVRVLVSGDSISQGFAGDYTWRYRLDQEFVRQHVAVDFVGPTTATFGLGDSTGRSLVPFSGDHHDARTGTKLSYQQSRIHDVVATYQPDVVLVMLGFNDLKTGATAANVVSNMRHYLTNVWSADPDATVVLSHVLADVVYPTSKPRSIPRAQVNAGYDALARQFRSQGRSIVVTDESAGWVARRHTTDGVHPNPTGETVIAQHYAVSLHHLGVLPAYPRIVRSRVAWATRAVPTVGVRGHVVRFRYGSWTDRLYMYHGLLRVSRLSGGHVWHVTGGLFATSARTTLPAGRYVVRLAPERHWLVGEYGPEVRFTVR